MGDRSPLSRRTVQRSYSDDEDEGDKYSSHSSFPILRKKGQMLGTVVVFAILVGTLLFYRVPATTQSLRSPTAKENKVVYHHPTGVDLDCPPLPKPGYPALFPLQTILKNWSPDDTNIPDQVYSSLCRFDYKTQLDQALAYQKAEVPFVIYNAPEVDAAVELWSDPNYLNEKFGDRRRKTEISVSNQFMYWKGNPTSKKWPTGYAPPNHDEEMTFLEWFGHATKENITNEEPHYYFRVKGTGKDSWVMDDLTFFGKRKSLFIVEPDQHRGINCRFGMPGVVAASHYDGGRNAIAMLQGQKRYVLQPPSECENVYLYGPGHPSHRHSAVKWEPMDTATRLRFPRFQKAAATELVLSAGEVLYLPSIWLHFIVSLEFNYQCNTRSGASTNERESLAICNLNEKTGYREEDP